MNKEYGKLGELKDKAKEPFTISDKDYPEGFSYIYARLPLDFKKRLLESLRIHFYYEIVKENSEEIAVDVPTGSKLKFFESMGRLKSYLIKDINNEEGK